MFGIGGGELMVIALVALIAVGPEQLPSVMRKLGGYAAQVRRMSDGVRSEFMSGMDELDPTKWTGDGSDEKPIVPRGYAESAKGSTAVPGSGPKPTSPKPKSTVPESKVPESKVPESKVAESSADVDSHSVVGSDQGDSTAPPVESRPINTIAAANARPTPVPESDDQPEATESTLAETSSDTSSESETSEPEAPEADAKPHGLDEELPST